MYSSVNWISGLLNPCRRSLHLSSACCPRGPDERSNSLNRPIPTPTPKRTNGRESASNSRHFVDLDGLGLLLPLIARQHGLKQWDGVHQECNPVRAATYMRIGPTRYRWEFRLLPSETADDYGTPAPFAA